MNISTRPDHEGSPVTNCFFESIASGKAKTLSNLQIMTKKPIHCDRDTLDWHLLRSSVEYQESLTARLIHSMYTLCILQETK